MRGQGRFHDTPGQLVDEIKKLRPDVKVLFISGYTADSLQKEDLEMSDEVGYISKPVQPDSLLLRINEIIG